MQIKPLKKFGQNYLTDKNIISKIAGEINPLPEDNILEIGPGLGSLTEHLYGRTDSLTAVEIDTRVIEDLRSRFPNLNLINGDFLKTDILPFAAGGKLKVAGNIPYNVTSPIIFKLIENNSLVKEAVLMVQLEVAQRMNAKMGTKDYGIFAVILNYFTETKLCFKISRNVFYPKPNVDSALVHLYFKELKQDIEFQKMYIRVVKASFGNRRKTLKNSLSNSIFAGQDFSISGIDLSKRAEQLTIDDFITLTNTALQFK
jgi:16S rRNA (adenine1518-N6/adenine1519-N6)-dimethyltransferase